MTAQTCQTMKIGITGSSGLVGSALAPLLTSAGHQVTPLRRTGGSFSPIERFDAVVHLAGEPLASGRWTAAKKSRIRDSRVNGTRTLCQTLARLHSPPRTIVCASAIGFYGDRGDELLNEQSGPGRGFLPEVVQAWEQAAQPAIERGIRVVLLRFGMILSQRGGALAEMLGPFRHGLGGRIGSGRQYWSWIALDDALGVIEHALATENLAGPVNVVAPEPVTNAQFAAELGHALGRPTWAHIPTWASRIVFGQMASELLLASTWVVPRRLLETGYTYQYPEIDDALRHLLTG